MDDLTAFWKHLCKAKAAELAGDTAIALSHLERAENLAGARDAVAQIQAWRKRLESRPRIEVPTQRELLLPPQPATLKRRTRKARA